jgi:hypothetical protein
VNIVFLAGGADMASVTSAKPIDAILIMRLSPSWTLTVDKFEKDAVGITGSHHRDSSGRHSS